MTGDPYNGRSLHYYRRLRRIREHMEQDLSRPLPAATAARIARLNRSYFSTYFLDKVGLPYSEWSRRVRIACAMRILLDESVPIPEVARRVGYKSLRAFERAFKRQTSVTPSQFRRRICG